MFLCSVASKWFVGNKIFPEFSMACLPVKVKYPEKCSSTDLFKFDRKLRERYNGHL